MKNFKKITAVVLIVMMTLVAATAIFADDAPTGKITLTNASAGQTYSVYKILDATYNATTGTTAYSTSDTAVKTAFANAKDDGGAAIFDVGSTADSAGNYAVAVVEGKEAEALAWVKANASTYGVKLADQDKTIATGNKIEWTLPYGYYYITTAAGTVLTLDNNTPSATVIDKNLSSPTTPDPVPEDPTKGGAKTAAQASASLGSEVDYTVTFTAVNFITTGEDAAVQTKQVDKYVIADTPTDVTLKAGSVVVKVNGATVSTAPTSFDANKKITLPWVDNDGNSIYASPATVVITYKATMDKTAVDGDALNKALISYTVKGSDTLVPVNSSDPGATIKTYEFSISKVDGSTPANALPGAEFKLYDAATGGNEIKVIKVTPTEGDPYYRVAVTGETPEVIVAGTAVVKGLKAGDYYLEETKAPLGYNMLTSRVKVEVKATGTNSVTVVNETGVELPSTGGTGTTLLIVFGAVLFIAAGVILVTKKRVYNEEA